MNIKIKQKIISYSLFLLSCLGAFFLCSLFKEMIDSNGLDIKTRSNQAVLLLCFILPFFPSAYLQRYFYKKFKLYEEQNKIT